MTSEEKLDQKAWDGALDDSEPMMQPQEMKERCPEPGPNSRIDEPSDGTALPDMTELNTQRKVHSIFGDRQEPWCKVDDANGSTQKIAQIWASLQPP